MWVSLECGSAESAWLAVASREHRFRSKRLSREWRGAGASLRADALVESNAPAWSERLPALLKSDLLESAVELPVLNGGHAVVLSNEVVKVAELLKTQPLCNFIYGHVGIAEEVIRVGQLDVVEDASKGSAGVLFDERGKVVRMIMEVLRRRAQRRRGIVDAQIIEQRRNLRGGLACELPLVEPGGGRMDDLREKQHEDAAQRRLVIAEPDSLRGA